MSNHGVKNICRHGNWWFIDWSVSTCFHPLNRLSIDSKFARQCRYSLWDQRIPVNVKGLGPSVGGSKVGARDAYPSPLGPIFSFSCSFRVNLAKIIGWRPTFAFGAPSHRLANPGSTTVLIPENHLTVLDLHFGCALLSRPNFLHFHAVDRNNWPNNSMEPVPVGLTPPLVNPGSATVE